MGLTIDTTGYERVLATYRNMSLCRDNGYVVFAMGPTGAIYSADPGDYFWLADLPDEVLLEESSGEPIILWRRDGLILPLDLFPRGRR